MHSVPCERIVSYTYYYTRTLYTDVETYLNRCMFILIRKIENKVYFISLNDEKQRPFFQVQI